MTGHAAVLLHEEEDGSFPVRAWTHTPTVAQIEEAARTFLLDLDTDEAEVKAALGGGMDRDGVFTLANDEAGWEEGFLLITNVPLAQGDGGER